MQSPLLLQIHVVPKWWMLPLMHLHDAGINMPISMNAFCLILLKIGMVTPLWIFLLCPTENIIPPNIFFMYDLNIGRHLLPRTFFVFELNIGHAKQHFISQQTIALHLDFVSFLPLRSSQYNVIRTGPVIEPEPTKNRLTKKYIKYSYFVKNIYIHVHTYESKVH